MTHVTQIIMFHHKRPNSVHIETNLKSYTTSKTMTDSGGKISSKLIELHKFIEILFAYSSVSDQGQLLQTRRPKDDLREMLFNTTKNNFF